MSSTGSSKHTQRLASTGRQRRSSFLSAPCGHDAASSEAEVEAPAQHRKLRQRRRLWEDADAYLPSTHLQIHGSTPPVGSVSSMEVNVDVLEQMDLMDVSDHEALDVFLSEGAVAPPPDAEVGHGERAAAGRRDGVRRGSTSSASSGGGAETPVVQSDDEEVHADNVLLTSVPQSRDEETDEEDDEERGRAAKSV